MKNSIPLIFLIGLLSCSNSTKKAENNDKTELVATILNEEIPLVGECYECTLADTIYYLIAIESNSEEGYLNFAFLDSVYRVSQEKEELLSSDVLSVGKSSITQSDKIDLFGLIVYHEDLSLFHKSCTKRFEIPVNGSKYQIVTGFPLIGGNATIQISNLWNENFTKALNLKSEKLNKMLN